MSTPIILITGALSGIGRATAVAFAKEGASVVVAGRREAEGTDAGHAATPGQRGKHRLSMRPCTP